MVQTIKNAIIELMFRKVIYLQYGILIVISMAIFGMFVDHMQFNRWFDKRSEKVANATIHYGNNSAESNNALWWFKNWDEKDKKGNLVNRRNAGFVIDECHAIADGYRDYEWNYKYFCDKLSIPTK